MSAAESAPIATALDAEANTAAAIWWLRSVGLDAYRPADLETAAERVGPAVREFATTVMAVNAVASQARDLGLRADAADVLSECAAKLMAVVEAIRDRRLAVVPLDEPAPATATGTAS